MDTRQLRSFLKIADAGSITRAAESLGIAQASLSQQLLRLESELGYDLVHRTARGVSLTEQGRIFQEHARQILRSTEQAIEDGRKFGAEPAGEVILAVPYSISKVAGTTLVEAFLRHAPQVSFRLAEAFTGQIRGWLDSGKVDLGILHDMGPLRHLTSRPIATEELYLVGPAARYSTIDATLDVPATEIAQLPMILPGRPHGLRLVIEQAAARLGITLQVRQNLDAMAHFGALIAAGHGYSILPLSIVSDALQSGRVSIARIGGGSMRRTLCLVRNNNQVVTHASVRCEDLTVKVLSRLIQKGVWVAEPDASLR